MRVENVFHNENTPPLQRRRSNPTHCKSVSGTTKRGNKKRGLRRRVVGLLDEEGASDEDVDEDDGLTNGDRPPVLIAISRFV